MNTSIQQKPVGRLLVTAACLAVASLWSPAQAADRTGKQVVESVCIQCHGPGKDGAPRIGNAYEWASHAKIGLQKLTENAISGIRKMPAHGGQSSLSDLEISRGVAYMVSNGQANDPERVYAKPNRWSGEFIVSEVCIACHGTGKDGAPKLGDFDAWVPRLKSGLDKLVVSAARGHNAMPARGGMASLSDVEVRSAVAYMVSRIDLPKTP